MPPVSSPAPAKEGGDGDADTDDPGGRHDQQRMAGGEAEVAEGFADDDVALDGQDNQGPQGDLACGEEKESPWRGQSPSGHHLPLVLPEESRGSWGWRGISSILLNNRESPTQNVQKLWELRGCSGQRRDHRGVFN